ncbi:hypothetical protein THAOC_33526 [Thalassiosira oceanica]|uniref:Uncharacterized protein n=1 Tax=Thalassiosira oceanica TaxID=159749 RepID=K0R515_THAOC|nr:hypothetical protein THAOC_33526 [Thalassiosira oceanica]|eukprot:EJK47735.1 hypothetical protein THAOC_33526 [Thalassiosira oceanica]
MTGGKRETLTGTPPGVVPPCVASVEWRRLDLGLWSSGLWSSHAWSLVESKRIDDPLRRRSGPSTLQSGRYVDTPVVWRLSSRSALGSSGRVDARRSAGRLEAVDDPVKSKRVDERP